MDVTFGTIQVLTSRNVANIICIFKITYEMYVEGGAIIEKR